jgi:uncharacterized membrane protein YfcA
MIDLTPLAWLTVAFGGLTAGFIDSIAGGGGLITLPVLLASGLPPHLAIGTNKVQSVFGSGTAAWRYGRRGLIPWRPIWPGIVMSLIASAAGAWTVRQIDPAFLEKVLPFILLALWCYVAFKKNLGADKSRERLPAGLFYPAAGGTIGFYDGFLGPGTGSFWTVSQVSLAGMDLRQATAATKPLNFASNLGALVFFLLSGQTIMSIGLVMAAGQVAGAWAGSHLVIKNTPRFIRPFFLVVVAATIMKLAWNQYGHFLRA